MFLPPVQHGATVLNRELFRRTVDVIGVRVPTSSVAKFLKVLNKDLFNQPKLKNVVNDPESSNTKIVLLNPKVESLELDDIPSDIKNFINNEGLGIVRHSVELNYDYWGADDIIKAILPSGVESPTSFTQVGHIAHMNLRDEFLPWKHIIGQVILDKNPKITTVVNKTDMIDTTYRFFKMEVLAGENNMIAEVKESNCRFRFDFSQVYWNSRLHTEHGRLLSIFKKGDYICDVFAGVGPFAIPAAKKGCIVYANDLNPASYNYLVENIKLNKVHDKVYPYNLDGKLFISKAVLDLQKAYDDNAESSKTSKVKSNATLQKQNSCNFNHFVMNLPATAIEFLDAFRGLWKDKETLFKSLNLELPMIHCYCFSKSDTPESEIVERINTVLGHPLQEDTYKIHFVRKVAPNKDMFCVSFRLSHAICYGFFSEKRKQDIINAAPQDSTSVEDDNINKHVKRHKSEDQ
ncbi:tRNA guanine37-N1-methyltransferase [Gigaspora margarita]|uniref:tRNA (guanine(37)-N1)-methyltransferase n=1 Tax=Gigaspora margarita TaxID=4874 RepID=A0A8H4B202_GIGMA|nr:tRNA guanine37-N1-methyltransferase [Gigaspora margarita]